MKNLTNSFLEHNEKNQKLSAWAFGARIQCWDDPTLITETCESEPSGFYAFEDGRLCPNQPNASEIEGAYRYGFVAGISEAIGCFDICGLKNELKNKRKTARCVVPHLGQTGCLDSAKNQARARGRHQAVCFAVQAIYYSEEHPWCEGDAEAMASLQAWEAAAEEWRNEIVTESAPCFSEPPMPMPFFRATLTADFSFDFAINTAINELRSAGGFIAELVDHNLATAIKPQPIFAFAGAIALVGSLVGRKFKDEFGTRSNVQIISVGETTCGKDHARKLNKMVLTSSGNDAVICSEEVTSDSSVYRALADHPCQLAQFDEFGRFLRTAQDPGKSFLYNVTSALMKLYTSADDPCYRPKGYADSRYNITISQPCFVLHGTSTPHVIYEAMGAAAVEDGFLGRCLIFESKEQPRRKMTPEQAIPNSIIHKAEYWRDFVSGPGNLSDQNPQPTVVPTTPEATQVFNEVADFAHMKLTKKGIGCALWGRSEQKTRQLALVLACGIDHKNPTIDHRVARIAAMVVRACTGHMIGIATDWLSSNLQEATSKRLYRVIKDHAGGLTKSQLTRKSQWLKARDRNDLLGSLMEAELIQAIEREGKALFVVT